MEITTALLWLIFGYIIFKLADCIYRYPWISRLTNKRILITGCDSGFGYEIAKRLDNCGIYVFAGCLTEAGEERLRKECSGRIKTVRMDVTKSESVQKAYEYIKKLIPEEIGLWGIINNAGVTSTVGPTEWSTLDDYNKVISVNLLGLIDTTVTFLPLVKKAKGRIVNTASMLGRVSTPYSAPYSVTKYGVECFSDALRRQMRDYSVSVHIIEPGFHKTNMGNTDLLGENMRSTWSRASKDLKEEYGEEYLEQAIENMVHKAVGSIVSDKIMNVVDAYQHAMVARFPRARYLIGKDARFWLIPINRLPEWISDWLLEQQKGRPIPKAVKENKY